jgi:hypothetical protein
LAAEHRPVRNGQRWCVTQVNIDGNRLAARRLEDNTLAVFDDAYVREHITHGYALTVHSAQGATADTLTRGREANTGYLYQRDAEHGYLHASRGVMFADNHGTSYLAAKLLRAIVTNDERATTAHALAITTAIESLSAGSRDMADRRNAAVRERTIRYARWRAAAAVHDHALESGRSTGSGLRRSVGDGLEVEYQS